MCVKFYFYDTTLILLQNKSIRSNNLKQIVCTTVPIQEEQATKGVCTHRIKLF